MAGDLLSQLPVTLSDKVGCIKRELRMRQQVYPRRVAAGKMKQDEADREVRILRAILSDYEP